MYVLSKDLYPGWNGQNLHWATVWELKSALIECKVTGHSSLALGCMIHCIDIVVNTVYFTEIIIHIVSSAK